MTDTTRPNPDALLAAVTQHEARARRGRLKVFFGMAAGVGKTYAMLDEARARAAEGAEVLVGYAEPHIRPETEALLLGMELLPYKQIEYRGSVLKEFDLDAALQRKPSLVLVDELAHTNAPGMRHPKRWQDVVELLEAGINVYATLNVQHIESVNDIVERITGVKVRETLPDAVLDQADEVELVDIAPEELLERFREGKIYRPEQAERAARHFFTRGNLIALRELALRKTAQRVDTQMLEARREAGVRSAWAASERVLVCVGPSPMSPRLVRSAKRLADSLRAEWVAATVETPRRLSDRGRAQLDKTLRLAEQLGARTVTLSGTRVAEEIVAYAQTHNVTKIVVGKPASPRWRDLLFGSVVDDLARSSGNIDLHVIRGEEESSSAPVKPSAPSKDFDWRGTAWATLTVAIATAIGWPLHHRVGLSNANVLMLYLLAVLWIATRHSRAAAIAASVLGVAAFDLTFVPPYYRFSVDDREYIVTFLVMLLTALVISALTLRVRTQAEAARRRENRTAALLALSRELSAIRSTAEVAAAAVRHVAMVFDARVLILTPGEGGKVRAISDSRPDASALDEKQTGVAQWAFDNRQPAGRDTSTLPASSGIYLPLNAARGTVGVLGLINTDGVASAPDQYQLLEAFANQSAVAMERAELAEEAQQAWERVEVEFLRNTLLSGVSHELRTPLAAITGSATALIDATQPLPEPAREQMLETIVGESDRMARLIENLLDMTRMEAGGLKLKKEWLPLREVIGASLQQLERRLKHRALTVDVPADLPLVEVDETGMEQVLTNLIDNAIEYTPCDKPIEIATWSDGGSVILEVRDRGPGLPKDAEERVFDKFFRAGGASGHGRRGMGLGLAICRGIIHAHGGTITARQREGGGAIFRIGLPQVGAPPTIEPTE